MGRKTFLIYRILSYRDHLSLMQLSRFSECVELTKLTSLCSARRYRGSGELRNFAQQTGQFLRFLRAPSSQIDDEATDGYE